MSGYEKYLDAIKKTSPKSYKEGLFMSEKEWKEAIGIVDEDAHIPICIRHKTGAKKVFPKMGLYI